MGYTPYTFRHERGEFRKEKALEEKNINGRKNLKISNLYSWSDIATFGIMPWSSERLRSQ